MSLPPITRGDPPRAVVQAVLARLKLDESGAVSGRPCEWWETSLRTFADRYGARYDEKLIAARRFLDGDSLTAVAVWTSGLAWHPRMLLALAEFAP